MMGIASDMSGFLDLLADSAILRLNWSDVEFGPVLGKGASGLVRKAIWKRYEANLFGDDGVTLLMRLMTRGTTRQEIATKELLLLDDGFMDAEVIVEFCKEIKYMRYAVRSCVHRFHALSS